MRVVNFILAALFLIFAFVQINDPDPYLWIAIYGIMAVLAILAMFNIYKPVLMWILLIGYAAYSFAYFDGVQQWLSNDNKNVIFDDVAKMEYPFIEYSREFLGLWICNIILIFYLIIARKKHR